MFIIILPAPVRDFSDPMKDMFWNNTARVAEEFNWVWSLGLNSNNNSLNGLALRFKNYISLEHVASNMTFYELITHVTTKDN